MKNKISKLIYNNMIIFSIVVSFYALVKLQEYNNMVQLYILIPLFYSLLMIITKKNRVLFGSNIGLTIINVMMFTKYSILTSLINHNYIEEALNHRNIALLTILVIVEMLSIFLIISFFSSDYSTAKIKKQHSKINIPIWITIFILIFVTITNPSYILNSFTQFGNTSHIESSSSNSIMIFVPIAIDFIYLAIILKINRNKTFNHNVTLSLSIFVSLLYILTKITGLSSSISRWNFLLYGISVVILHMYLYANRKRLIMVLFSTVAIIGLFVLTSLKFNISGRVLEQITDPFILDAYFNGPIGLNKAIELTKLDTNFFMNQMILTDLFSALPILGYPFRGITSVNHYHDYIGRTDLIIPMLGQSFMYFGLFGSGILTAFYTLLVVKLNKVLLETKDIFLYYSMLLVVVWLSFFMALNVNIVQENIWRKLIFFFIAFINYKFNNIGIKENLKINNPRTMEVDFE